MKEKVIALCSGGFDSICLMHYLKEQDFDVEAIFFDYGQKSLEQERECTRKICEKLDFIFTTIKLPTMIWTSGDFYKDGFSKDKEFLEMRNLIFISYGLSYAQSYRVKKLYLATLKSLGYYDTSERFLTNIAEIGKDIDIYINTPFSNHFKEELTYLSYKYNITEDDFFSCDNPVNKQPCGVCPDCVSLENIMENNKIKLPYKELISRFTPSEDFNNLFLKSPINEIRVLTNNDCQLSCKHCYYGDNKMLEKPLTIEEFTNVFKQAEELGINKFHFSGKEPLYDDLIFKLCKVIKSINSSSEITVVTNGINVNKYLNNILESGISKIFLSADDSFGEREVELREVFNVTENAIKSLKSLDIEIEIFIDLYLGNYKNVVESIRYLYETYKINSFYIRASVPLGNAKNLDRLCLEKLEYVLDSLIKSDIVNNKDIFITYVLPIQYVYEFKTSSQYYLLKELIYSIQDTMYNNIIGNLYLYPEFYCDRFENQITITPDGYIHGCASDISVKEYDKISSGNVREKSLQELINIGKNNSLEYINSKFIKDGYNCNKCFCNE